jgi:glycosyltransferase involved in cell wall biosynthesis
MTSGKSAFAFGGKTSMNISVIGAKGLPAKQGGIEHYCQEIYPRMVKQGHQVDLFARANYVGTPWLHQYEVQGVRIMALPSLNLRGLDALASSALGALVSSRKHYDVVHIHALGPALFSALPKLALSATKVVVSCQGLDWSRAKWGNISSRILHLGERTAVRFADDIIVVSEELRSYFKKTYNRDTIYIPNGPAGYGLSDKHFHYGTSLGLQPNKYMVFLGRLVPEKRPELLIQSFQALRLPGWKLVLVGGSSDTLQFSGELSEIAGGNPSIIFAGELYGEQLAEIVRGAGLFVLPSDVEGLPLAMLEAMREGIPVVASDIPAHQQLLLGGQGMLFRAGDVDSCADALSWAVHHTKEMAAMATKAKKHIQVNYNWDQITSETLAVYEGVSSSYVGNKVRTL